MKVKALKKFRDVKENVIRNKDEVFEADEKRIAEIQEVDATLIEVLPEGEQKAEESDIDADNAAGSETKKTGTKKVAKK